MKSLKDIRKLDIDKAARAIEVDAGRPLRGLRGALAEAKEGKFAQTHTPAQMTARRRGRPVGSTKATAKIAIKLRLDADVAAVLRASGDGWQTRINETLRASLALSGKL